MSPLSGLLPGLEPFAALLHRVTYGAGYRRARKEAFARSNKICQHCGLRPATQAHHWALRYPADHEITANDLTALCDRCHHGATFQRLLDRVGCAGMWFILAMAFEERWARPRSDGAASRRRHVARHRPRICSAPERAAEACPAPEGLQLDLRSLVVKCKLTLVAGCLACDRFVRLNAVEPFRLHGWSGSIQDLRRRLCCCRCRSRTRWILLAYWPPEERDASARPPRLPFGDPRDRS